MYKVTAAYIVFYLINISQIYIRNSRNSFHHKFHRRVCILNKINFYFVLGVVLTIVMVLNEVERLLQGPRQKQGKRIVLNDHGVPLNFQVAPEIRNQYPCQDLLVAVDLVHHGQDQGLRAAVHTLQRVASLAQSHRGK